MGEGGRGRGQIEAQMDDHLKKKLIFSKQVSNINSTFHFELVHELDIMVNER